jgi:hypothetical protein
MVLIYPYYTVHVLGRQPVQHVHLRHEHHDPRQGPESPLPRGQDLAEVLDFNVYLSPNDMWVCALRPDGTGPNDPARLGERRRPVVYRSADPGVCEPFKNFAMTGADALPGTTLDRTREAMSRSSKWRT